MRRNSRAQDTSTLQPNSTKVETGNDPNHTEVLSQQLCIYTRISQVYVNTTCFLC